MTNNRLIISKDTRKVDLTPQHLNLEQIAKKKRSQLLTTFCNHQAQANDKVNENNIIKENTTELEKETHGILQKIKTTPQDYIAAAKIYSYQGKQQQVIDMCQQGLLLSSSSSASLSSSFDNGNNNDCCVVLQQELNIAKEKMERRIDFITQCPVEIAHTIIDYLDFNVAIKAVSISRNWRSTFLNNKRIWQQFVLDGAGKQRKLAQLLNMKSKHIKILYIDAWPDKIKRYLTTSIKKIQFLNLKSLVITDIGDDKIDPDVHLGKALYQVLPTISNTLKRLDIYSQSFVNISLGRILLLCPNLKSLKLHIYSLDDSTSARDLLPSATLDGFTTSPLRNLEISSTCPLALQLIQNVLRAVLSYIPDLRRLAIYYDVKYNFDTGDILEMVPLEHCKKLEVIKTGLLTTNTDMYNDDGFLYYNRSHKENKQQEQQRQQKYNNNDYNVLDGVLLDEELEERKAHRSTSIVANRNNINDDYTKLVTTMAETTTSSKKNGLRHVRLHSVNSATQLRNRLEASCSTLETLALRLGIAGIANINIHHLEILSSLLMPKLKTLQLSKFNRMLYRNLPATIDCCPNLETLILEYPITHDSTVFDPEVVVNNDINSNNNNRYNSDLQDRLLLNSIIVRPNIKRLAFIFLNELSPVFFEQLTDHYRTSTTSKLEYLKIARCSGLSYECVQHMARIPSLKELSLQFNYNPRFLHFRNNNNNNSQLNGGYDSVSYHMETFTNYLTYDLARPQVLTRLELDHMKLTDIAVQNIVKLCNRNDTLLQDALIIKDCIGISFESAKLLKNIAKLYRYFDFSETNASPFIPILKTFIFTQKL